VLHHDPPHGYARTSVAAVVERAGVSSKAFDEHVTGTEPHLVADRLGHVGRVPLPAAGA
jgi:AcrR family transcriptional regulator